MFGVTEGVHHWRRILPGLFGRLARAAECRPGVMPVTSARVDQTAQASGGVRDYTRLKVVAYLARAQMLTSP